MVASIIASPRTRVSAAELPGAQAATSRPTTVNTTALMQHAMALEAAAREADAVEEERMLPVIGGPPPPPPNTAPPLSQDRAAVVPPLPPPSAAASVGGAGDLAAAKLARGSTRQLLGRAVRRASLTKALEGGLTKPNSAALSSRGSGAGSLVSMATMEEQFRQAVYADVPRYVVQC